MFRVGKCSFRSCNGVESDKQSCEIIFDYTSLFTYCKHRDQTVTKLTAKMIVSTMHVL